MQHDCHAIVIVKEHKNIARKDQAKAAKANVLGETVLELFLKEGRWVGQQR
jgi:hypothetical protein